MIQRRTIMLLLLCASVAGLHAQAPFNYNYDDPATAGGGFSDGARASNGDLLITEGTLVVGRVSLMRLDPQGQPLWAVASTLQGSGMKGILERPNGELLLGGLMYDIGTTNLEPSFHRFDANGSWLDSRYYRLDTLHAFIRGAIATTAGRMVTVFSANDPALYGLIAVDGTGQLLWCKTYPMSQSLLDYVSIAPAPMGATLMFYTDVGASPQARARMVSSNGQTLWERAYTIQGSGNGYVEKLVRITDDLYAAQYVLPSGAVQHASGVLFISGSGDVISAHAYQHASLNFGYGSLWSLGDDKLLFSHALSSGTPTVPILARIDTTGQILDFIPYDTATSQMMSDALPMGADTAYLVYAPDQIMLRPLTDPQMICEEAGDPLVHILLTASSMVVSTPSANLVPTMVTITPDFFPVDMQAVLHCNTTGLVTPLPRAAGVSVYPTPATDAIHLAWANGTGQAVVRIVDALGHLIRVMEVRGAMVDLDVTDLPHGIYTVRCIGNGSSAVGRFVKE
ncbi:MAG: T9SS type A sorting domain-containing protein [Flavobacteriales bacterium]|nr:T9SS type A sorting domain-containing protein [Flavobacteriales bacterium]